MGNSPSSKAENAVVSSEEKEEKYSDELQQLSELRNKLKQIELSLEQDPSEANALLQFFKALQLKHDINGGLTGIKDIISSAQTQWNIMDEALDAFKKHAPKEVNDIKGLKIDYCSLLQHTRVEMSSLIKQSEIQRENIQHLIRLKNIQLESDDLIFEKKKDKKMYDLYMQTLTKFSKFINDSDWILTDIVKKWIDLCEKIQEKQDILIGLYKTYKKQMKNKKIALYGGLVTLGTLGGVLLIVLTAGIATPFVVAAEVGLVAGTGAAGTGAAATGVAAAAPAGVAFTQYKKKKKELQQMVFLYKELEEKARNGIINGMIKNQLKSNEQLKRSTYNICSAINSFTKVDKYLQVYSKEGHEVVDIIINSEVKNEKYFGTLNF